METSRNGSYCVFPQCSVVNVRFEVERLTPVAIRPGLFPLFLIGVAHEGSAVLELRFVF